MGEKILPLQKSEVLLLSLLLVIRVLLFLLILLILLLAVLVILIVFVLFVLIVLVVHLKSAFQSFAETRLRILCVKSFEPYTDYIEI